MPAVYQLLGFPGTGKYTIARAVVEALEARAEPAALLDNHSTANLVWSLVPAERQFDRDVMAHINRLRMVLLDAAAEVTSTEHSIVFTNFVPAGRSAALLDHHRDLAKRLGRPLVAVVLHCEANEVLRRVPSPDRAGRMKLVDLAVARQVMASGMTLPDWPELVNLEITDLSPDQAAARVIALADDRERGDRMTCE